MPGVCKAGSQQKVVEKICRSFGQLDTKQAEFSGQVALKFFWTPWCDWHNVIRDTRDTPPQVWNIVFAIWIQRNASRPPEMLGSCNSLGLIEAFLRKGLCRDVKWSPGCRYVYSKCKRSSGCQDQINSINQSFRAPPHPFRSLELHFQTTLQGPCMPDSMYYSPVAATLMHKIERGSEVESSKVDLAPFNNAKSFFISGSRRWAAFAQRFAADTRSSLFFFPIFAI